MEAGDSMQAPAKLFVGILCAVALVLIVTILSGSRLDRDGARAVGMAVALAGFSLTGSAGLRLAGKRPEMGLIGILALVLSVAGFLAVSALLWGDLDGGPDARVAGVIIVLALAAGHLSVLLASARPGDSEGLRLLRGGVVVCLGALTLMAVVELTEHGEELDWRLAGVIAVLYVLGSVLLPVVKHASPDAAGSTAVLAEPSAARVSGIDHAVIAVSDRSRSDWFYGRVLGATIESLENGRVAYRFGGQRLNVHQADVEAAPLAARPVQPGGSDLCLAWDGPAEAALEHLRRHGVVGDGPVPRRGARGAGESVYCRDPDGSLIELISYFS
jgi:catechol 2,3-dioxygenase-like lactoylglutathione lyase family enzyme